MKTISPQKVLSSIGETLLSNLEEGERSNDIFVWLRNASSLPFASLRRSESLILADFASFDRVQEYVLNQFPLPIQVDDTWLGEGVK